MGDSCQQPDIRNRYEGRGSGDRIARLKTAAINARTLPWKKDASIITEIAKAGTCCQGGCTGANCDYCKTNYICTEPTAVSLGNTITGVLQGDGTLRFDLFQLGGCTTDTWCTKKFFWNYIMPIDIYIKPTPTCGIAYIVDPNPISSTYPKTITTSIDFSTTNGTPAPIRCQGDASGTLITNTFTLLYP